MIEKHVYIDDVVVESGALIRDPDFIDRDIAISGDTTLILILALVKS